MTTIDTHAGSSLSAENGSMARSSFLVAVADWLTSCDHKKIGRLFLSMSGLGAVVAGVLGVLVGIERISPDSSSIISTGSATQFISMFRFVLAYIALAPLFVGIAIAIVPLQIGARALAYPRLAQFGMWAWFFGVVLVVISVSANGGPTGSDKSFVTMYLLGLAMTALGVIAASIPIIATILTSRAPGMDMMRVPAFTWSAMVGATANIVTLPVFIGTLAYLYVDNEHASVAFGGADKIWDWIGWGFTQPQTIVFAIMAVGVLAEIAPVVSRVRQALRPVVFTGIGLISIAALGAATQSQHTLTWEGSASDIVQDIILWGFFNVLPLLGMFVVLAVSVLAVISGRIRLNAGFVFAFLGVGMLLVGLAGNVLYLFTDAALLGTVFEEGVFTYVVYGTVMAGMGAVSYWGPKLWGRKMPDKETLGLAGLALIGTVLASFPYYIAGFADQPANALGGFEYGGPSGLWNTLVTIGHAVFALAVIAFFLLAAKSFRNGEAAGDDPWDGHTLEWATSSPAPANNFVELSIVGSSEPLLDVKPSSEEVSA
jgi:heme/copper-type cytochrome/quinol oxidase subunit 1